MLRDKDKELSRACSELAGAGRDALAWFSRNADAVGEKHPALMRQFAKAMVEARKLAQAAERPMAVAVFGTSQAGKTNLMGSLISTKQHPVKVIFAGEGEEQRYDFLNSINPQGGKETTGIVTRFSMQPMESPVRTHPVILRVLREVDVLKILANTFVLELSGIWQDGGTSDTSKLTATVNGLPTQAPSAGIALEDIYELREYINAHLPAHPLATGSSEPYWRALEAMAPKLAATERSRAFAPLWGELPEFTDLYVTLKAALDDLKHPAWMYASIEAVLDRAYGVLHAETLYALDAAYAAKLEGDAKKKTIRTSIVADNGVRMDLPRPIVTALAAELRLTLDGRAWDFLEHTDLLDFPGAKSREGKSPQKFLRQKEGTHNRAYCYLRGKVGVLFDKYVDDFETNALVLAIDDSQAEVTTLPGLIEEWVHRTHGETPEARAMVSPVSMFFTLTKCDTLFKLDSNTNSADSVRNRVGQNLSKYQSWMRNWAHGRPFDNVFFYRNVKVHQPAIVQYDGPWLEGDNEKPSETGYTLDFDTRREPFRTAYLSVSEVQTHVAAASEKYDALLSLNDGGISYLAKSLRPVCDLDLKFRQIEPVKNRLRDEMLAALNEFHEASDVTRRIADRLSAVHRVVDALSDNVEQFGPFIREYQVEPTAFSRAYLSYTSRRGQARGQAASSGDRGSALRRGLSRASSDVTGAVAAEPLNSNAFGSFAMSIWREGLAARAKDDALARGLGVTIDQLATVMNEILGYAAITRLESRIDQTVSVIERMPRRPDEIASRIGMAVARLINGCVGNLGYNDVADTSPPPRYPSLPEDIGELENVRVGYFVRWIRHLEEATTSNARQGQGGRLPVDQNARLGEIIERVRAA